MCSVLDSLEREYKREDDMLQKHLVSGEIDRVTLITQLISKHQEQKEAFLKACTLARRTAETFLKYSNRSLQFFNQPSQSTFKGPESKVKGRYFWWGYAYIYILDRGRVLVVEWYVQLETSRWIQSTSCVCTERIFYGLLFTFWNDKILKWSVERFAVL